MNRYVLVQPSTAREDDGEEDDGADDEGLGDVSQQQEPRPTQQRRQQEGNEDDVPRVVEVLPEVFHGLAGQGIET